MFSLSFSFDVLLKGTKISFACNSLLRYFNISLKTENSSFGSFVFKILLSPLPKLYSEFLNLFFLFFSFKVISPKISYRGSMMPILSETSDSMFLGSKIAKISSSIRIYNPRVTKPSYKTELRIMTSQTELLTLEFYFFKFLVSNSM